MIEASIRVGGRKRRATDIGLDSNNRKRKNIKNAVEEVNLRDFQPLNGTQAQLANQIFHNSSLIRSLYLMCARNLLSGGVLIRRVNDTNTNKKKRPKGKSSGGFPMDGGQQSSMLDRVESNMWRCFVQQCLKSLWIYGFVACVIGKRRDEQLYPVVLDLELCLVYMRTNAFGQRQYAFVRNDAGYSGINNVLDAQQQSLIPDVYVFELDPPAPNGDLRSRMFSALDDVMLYHSLSECARRSTAGMANPCVVIGREQPRYDPDTLTYMLGVDPQPVIDSHFLTPSSAKRPTNNAAISDASDALCTALNRTAAKSVTSGVSNLIVEQLGLQNIGDQVLAQTHGGGGGDTGGPPRLYSLQSGETVQGQVNTSESKTWLEFRIALEQRMGALFGVPRYVWATEYRDTAAALGGMSMLRDAQRDIKHFLENIMHVMDTFMYSEENALQYITERTSTGMTFNTGQLIEETDTEISLHGIPSDNTIWLLYRAGMLRYEAFRDIVCARDSIPLHCFHPQPQLDLEELNGINLEVDTSTDLPKKKPMKKSATSS